MIDLYTWKTPNGRKVSIALEELSLDYKCHPVDLGNKENHTEEYKKINPHNTIPVIFDQETGVLIRESGAILLYLSEKTKKLLPIDIKKKWLAHQWLMWQMSGLGPSFGQMHHFVKHNPDVSSYGADRFITASKRMYNILDQRLAEAAYVAEEYSIADIAIWPWVARFEWHPISLDDYPNVKRWYLEIAKRPAVQTGYEVPDPSLKIPIPA